MGLAPVGGAGAALGVLTISRCDAPAMSLGEAARRRRDAEKIFAVGAAVNVGASAVGK